VNVGEYTDDKGRKYSALIDGDKHIVIGPPEGLVDKLELPEPFATNLHNILYRRKIFKFEDVQRRPKELFGALQECLRLDVQKITAIFFEFEKE